MIQIAPDAIIARFSEKFLDRGSCEALLLELLGLQDRKCPDCGEDLSRTWDLLWMGRQVSCRACGSKILLWKNTNLEGFRATAQETVLIAVLVGLGCRPLRISRLIKGRGAASVYDFVKRFTDE